uniref:Dephospho-CoA kinase domain-containing protein n=1 Tax=Panagrellus redivivus TaxID=6233 RepID=A0A7E4VP63_PANRE
MFIIGLTGGIATGKSTVVATLKQRGVAVVDADELARQVVEPGTSAHTKLREAFGDEFFDNEGRLKRDELAEVIFNDAEKRRKLNSITHPAVARAMLKAVLKLFLTGSRYVVLDIPLLFESGANKFVQKVLVVHCSDEAQVTRLMARDKISRSSAEAKIRSQMNIQTKIDRATHLIDNNGTKEATITQVHEFVDKMNASWIPFAVRFAIFFVVGITIGRLTQYVF